MKKLLLLIPLILATASCRLTREDMLALDRMNESFHNLQYDRWHNDGGRYHYGHHHGSHGAGNQVIIQNNVNAYQPQYRPYIPRSVPCCSVPYNSYIPRLHIPSGNPGSRGFYLN